MLQAGRSGRRRGRALHGRRDEGPSPRVHGDLVFVSESGYWKTGAGRGRRGRMSGQPRGQLHWTQAGVFGRGGSNVSPVMVAVAPSASRRELDSNCAADKVEGRELVRQNR